VRRKKIVAVSDHISSQSMFIFQFILPSSNTLVIAFEPPFGITVARRGLDCCLTFLKKVLSRDYATTLATAVEKRFWGSLSPKKLNDALSLIARPCSAQLRSESEE